MFSSSPQNLSSYRVSVESIVSFQFQKSILLCYRESYLFFHKNCWRRWLKDTPSMAATVLSIQSILHSTILVRRERLGQILELLVYEVSSKIRLIGQT